MRTLGLMCVFGTLVGTASVATAERRTQVVDRMEAAAIVLDEVMAAPERGVPAEILHDARCIVIVPGFSKGAFIVGGSSGKGVASCRSGTTWSAPAPIAAGGASIGLQAGGSKSDVVLLLMNERAKDDLLMGKVKGSSDISVEAGPVGAHVKDTRPQQAAVYSYSRSKGLFGGVAYKGVKMDEDKDATIALYGRAIPIGDILNGSTPVPAGSEHLMESLRERAGIGAHAVR